MAQPNVMYGTPQGIATDQGAAEALRRAGQVDWTPNGVPRGGPYVPPEGAAAYPPAGPGAAPSAAPGVPKAPPTAASGGWFQRTAAGMKSAPGKAAGILDADLGAAGAGALRAGASGVGSAVNSLRAGVGRAALPVAAMSSAYGSYSTPTDTFADRTGISADTAGGVPARLAGTMQDLGNTLTMGVADRAQNLLRGNGWNRSPGNQVGEIGGRGSEVGDAEPTAAPNSGSPAAAANVPPGADYGHEGNQPAGGGSATGDGFGGGGGGTVLRQGNSFSGANVPFNDTTKNADGSLRTGFGVSSLDTSQGYRQDQLELQRNAQARAEQNANMQTSMNNIGHAGSQFPVTPSLSVLGPTGTVNSHERLAMLNNAFELAKMDRANNFAHGENMLREGGENMRAGMQIGSNQGIAGMHNNTALRGQDIELQGRLAPLQYAQAMRQASANVYRGIGAGGADGTAPITPEQHQQAGDRLHAMGLKDEANSAYEAASKGQALKGTQQTQAQAGHESMTHQFDGVFTKLDDKGNKVPDTTASAEAAARMMREVPGVASMTQTERAPYVAHYTALARLQKNGLGTDSKVGWRALNPLGSTAAPDDALPNTDAMAGAKLERYSPLAGKIVPGATAGGYVLTTKDGRQMPLPADTDSSQLNILRNAIAGKGWGPQVSK